MAENVYYLDGYFGHDDAIPPGIFRKMSDCNHEKRITSLLQTISPPHPNIVKILSITNECIDMEKVDVPINETKDFIHLDKFQFVETAKYIKAYLQSHGIVYIDWKLDNFGIMADGTIKLFDFDASGWIDTDGQWLLHAPISHNYNAAWKKGYVTPIEIDDYCFSRFIEEYLSYYD